MVTNVTSLSGNGLRDWLIQRVSAVILIIFVLYLALFMALHHPVHYSEWSALFESTYMRVLSFLSLLSFILHAWVGIWTVITDYIKTPPIKIFVQVLVALSLLSYLAWGLLIIW